MYYSIAVSVAILDKNINEPQSKTLVQQNSINSSANKWELSTFIKISADKLLQAIEKLIPDAAVA